MASNLVGRLETAIFLVNLVDIYLPLADRWTIWDASTTRPRAVLDSAQGDAVDLRSILHS